MTKRRLLLATLAFAAIHLAATSAAFESLGTHLNDEEFWKLSSESSEPDGYFRSDNLLSNEIWFQYVIPDLIKTAKAGRVYLGVGPEQNYTYIAALKPKMAFIIDIRRGNLELQLMYKALFELSKDRAEFLSRLFSRKKPEGLTEESSARELFAAYMSTEPNEAVYKENLKGVLDQLTKKHHFPLTADDIDGIDYVYRNFHQFGPRINYSSSQRGGFGGFNRTTYADLMIADDGAGNSRSYLASEENFAFLKDLESRNMLVPVVGDFGGPKAIRAVGAYLKEKGAIVSAFYLSNVEQYLSGDGKWNTFCRNVVTLPIDDSSAFIRSVRGGQFGGLSSELGNIATDIMPCSAHALGAVPRDKTAPHGVMIDARKEPAR